MTGKESPMKRLLGGVLLGATLAIAANVMLFGSLMTSGPVELALFAGAGVALIAAMVSLGLTASFRTPRRRSVRHPAGRARLESVA
jgi:hypothetical protein